MTPNSRQASKRLPVSVFEAVEQTGGLQRRSAFSAASIADDSSQEWKRWQVSDPDYRLLRNALLVLMRVDLDHYRTRHMERRLAMLLERRPYASWGQYVEALRRNVGELIEFSRYFTINVSSFFRDAAIWQYLWRNLLPGLLHRAANRGVRAWSVGCSIGAEAYTLAMLLREEAPLLPHSITGIDIDEFVLQRARDGGPYCTGEVQELPPHLLNRYMTRNGKQFSVQPPLRAMVEFKHSNILREESSGHYDIILCRNVLIYFAHYVKERIYERLLRHLRPGGLLILGATETISFPAKLGLDYITPSLYRYNGP